MRFSSPSMSASMSFDLPSDSSESPLGGEFVLAAAKQAAEEPTADLSRPHLFFGHHRRHLRGVDGEEWVLERLLGGGPLAPGR